MNFKTRQILFLNMMAVLMVVFYQNCGEQFSVSQEFASKSDSTYLSVPEIEFSDSPAIVNTTSLSQSFTVEFVGRATAKSILCQWNDQAPTNCASGTANLANAPDGEYVLRVTVETTAGMRNENSRIIRKDTRPPEVRVALTPANPTNQQVAAFEFNAVDSFSGVQRIECSLDGGPFAVCATRTNLPVPTAGPHNFRIRAIDLASNISQVYSYDWTIDLTVPTVMITSYPEMNTNSTNPSFAFSGATIVSYECQLDNGVYTMCTSPRNYSGLSEGAHIFRVRGTSAAGNLSAPRQYSWSIDATPPTVPVITTAVSAITASRVASFNFASTDAGSGLAGYQCANDGGAYAACVSPYNLANIQDGQHSLRVRAQDQTGNFSQPVLFAWQVDGTSPVLTFTQTPTTSTSTTATVTFNAADVQSGLASVQCSLDAAAFSNCTSPVTLSNLAVASHTYRVQARDMAGNMNTITHTWAVAAAPPTSTPPPAATPGPTPTPTGPIYYFSNCQTGAAAGCVPGNNANPGTATAPKQTLAGMNVNTLPAGTRLLFNRGGAWLNFAVGLENPNTTAAQPLIFDAYGTGPLPWLKVASGNMFNLGGNFNNQSNDGGYVIRNLKLDGMGTAEWGIWFVQNVRDVTLENSEVTGFRIGVNSNDGTPYGVNGITLRNNSISRNRAMGLLGHYHNLLIESNLFEANNFGGSGFDHGSYIGGGGNITIRNNRYIRNSVVNGICTGGNMTFHGQIDGALIEGNVILQDAAAEGCWLMSITQGYTTPEAFRNFVVRNNRLINGGNTAMAVQSAPGIVVQSNVAINTQATGQTAFFIGSGPGPHADGDAGDANAVVRDNVACRANPNGSGSVVNVNSPGATVTNNVTYTGTAATTGVCAL